MEYFYTLDVVTSYIMGWREYTIELSLDMQEMARRVLDEHHCIFVFCRVLCIKGMFVYYDPVCQGHINKPRPLAMN
jgi:hypothetical protein